jgi:hypothetical protein
VNPQHLRWGTAKENTMDQFVDGTSAKGAGNPSAKLTPEQVSKIREDNRIHRIIAEDYGVSRSQISKIKKGVAW